ncbi:hypothetical protein Slin_6949 (plasmid) [Spirosoma linguale DSM 74]|uniref:DUF308 domain-containing protein n=2 Tax=Spirosoma TaxID=107 RepID=D2QVR1_SPILD|nr:hypothetical protein Slin_6949 [Spirosoma linguale DSM 74]
MTMKTLHHPAQPWWLMHLHNVCYALMGVALLIHPTETSPLRTGLLGGLLLLAGICTLTLGMRRRQRGDTDNLWFILSSGRDIIFGIWLLAVMNQPMGAMINTIGLWAIIYAFLQAIEANFYFLGTRANEDKDYWVEVIHFACVFIAGGFAFLLIMRPDGLTASLGYVGLFLVGLGLVQELLTRMLQRDATRYVN